MNDTPEVIGVGEARCECGNVLRVPEQPWLQSVVMTCPECGQRVEVIPA